MKSNTYTKHDINKKIRNYKKRLDKLKNQGFQFSNSIYKELDLLENKIHKKSILNKIWNEKISTTTKKVILLIVIVMSIISISWIFLPNELEIDVSNIEDGKIIDEFEHDIYIIRGTASSSKGIISQVQVNINDKWVEAIGTNQWRYKLDIKKIPEGTHTITFRSTDGVYQSKIEQRTVRILKINSSFNIQINIDDGKTIYNDLILKGTSSCTRRNISTVMVKVDDNIWKTVNGTDFWSYELKIDELSEGVHNISVRCSDGYYFSDTKTVTLIIVKSKKPVIEIVNPTNNAINLSGIVVINGTASAKIGHITNIQISINHGEFRNVSGNEQWHTNWNTKSMNNSEDIIIKAKCYDSVGQYNSSEITVSLFNEPSNPEFVFPDYNGDLFQFYIPTKQEILKPGNNYTLEIYHRRKEENRINNIFLPIYTTLEISQKPSWLHITMPAEPIVTPADNKSRNYSISFTISENATQDSSHSLTIYYSYNARIKYFITKNFQLFDLIDTLINPPDPIDITLFIGRW